MQYEIQPPQPKPPYAKQFWLGIGLGSIPLILALVGIGAVVGGTALSGIGSILLVVGLFLYMALLVAAIVCLFIREVRFLGYGLLTLAVTSPVIAYIGCVVIYSAINSRH